MSDRRAARGPGGQVMTLPTHLRWRGADDPCWWIGGTQPHGLERFQAHRRHRAARRAFIAALTTRPIGVREHEWTQAHREDA